MSYDKSTCLLHGCARFNEFCSLTQNSHIQNYQYTEISTCLYSARSESPIVLVSDVIISLRELVGDAVLGDEAGVVRALAVERLLVGVPAHGGAQHLAQERAVAARLALGARHHRVRYVAEQLWTTPY